MIPRFRNRRGCDKDMCGLIKKKKRCMPIEIIQQIVLGTYKTKFILLHAETGCPHMY